MPPNLFYEAGITLKGKLNSAITVKQTYILISLMNIDTKTFEKLNLVIYKTVNISWYIKAIVPYQQIKEIISMKKNHWQNTIPVHDKKSQQARNRRECPPSIKKAPKQNLTTSFLLNTKRQLSMKRNTKLGSSYYLTVGVALKLQQWN